MSVRGIDLQIAAQRTADIAKAAENQKSGERMQEYLALQRNEEERIRRTSVTRTEGAEKAVIARDGEGAKHSPQEESEKGSGMGKDAEPEEEMPESSCCRIDIRI